MQDQIFTIDAGRDGEQDYSLLTMQDRGDYPITEALEANQRISKLPEDQRNAEYEKFRAAHPYDHTRVVLGRGQDGAAILRLRDGQGRDRVVIRVPRDGNPSLQMLDADGKVLDELPREPAASPSQR